MKNTVIIGGYGAKDLTDRRIADYIGELDNTGLTISRISSKRNGLYPNFMDL